MRKWIWAILALLLVAALFSAALAQSGQFALPWHTIDSGGGRISGGEFALEASIGQPDAGSMSGGDFSLAGGFIVPPAMVEDQSRDIYLPLLAG